MLCFSIFVAVTGLPTSSGQSYSPYHNQLFPYAQPLRNHSRTIVVSNGTSANSSNGDDIEFITTQVSRSFVDSLHYHDGGAVNKSTFEVAVRGVFQFYPPNPSSTSSTTTVPPTTTIEPRTSTAAPSKMEYENLFVPALGDDAWPRVGVFHEGETKLRCDSKRVKRRMAESSTVWEYSDESRMVFSMPHKYMIRPKPHEHDEHGRDRDDNDHHEINQVEEEVMHSGSHQEATGRHGHQNNDGHESVQRYLSGNGAAKIDTFLCFQASPNHAIEEVGKFHRHHAPTISPHALPLPKNAHVKVFLNPGWHLEIPIKCINCTRTQNIVAIKPYAGTCVDDLIAADVPEEVPNLPDLRRINEAMGEDGFRLGNEFIRSIQKDENCEKRAPDVPCGGLASDNALAYAYMEENPNTGEFGKDSVVFLLSSQSRVVVRKHELVTRQFCFYADNNTVDGVVVGDVTFKLDADDMQAFVVFIIFFGVAMPIICVVSGLLHIHKMDKCREVQRQGLFDLERERMERELVQRGVSPADLRRNF